MFVHLCVLICVYICVYIYVSLTHITHVHTFMYICAQNLTHTQALINTRLFLRLFDYIFVCVSYTASTCIRLYIRLRSYFATVIVPELIFTVYIHIQHSIKNDDASDDNYIVYIHI